MLPDPDRSRAVLIGASQFSDPELPDLPAVRNNLDGLAACFRDPALWGLPAAHCTLVADPESGVALIDAIHDAAAEAEDTLLIYYAGHGLVHPRTLGLLLAVTGSRPGRPHTAVPYDQVRDNLIDSRATRKVVILDCCYSGRAVGGMADTSETVANEATVEGTYLLASAPPNRQALSPPGETYTAFTGELLTLIREGVPNGPELLQLDAIYRHIRDTLKRRALPEPQIRIDNTAGELALVRNHGHRPIHDIQLRYVRVRGRIQKLVRWNGYWESYTCPVCQAGCSGYDLIRHFDMHTPVETVALDPVTLTLKAGGPPPGDRYELGKCIGRYHQFGRYHRGGGIIWIHLAIDTMTRQTVVVKQRLSGSIDDRIVGLNHQGIVRVLDTNQTREGRYIVSEYVDGRVLDELLPVEPLRAVEIMTEICDALAYAHQNGLFHGDIKAANMMLTQEGRVKVLNFGYGGWVTDPRLDVDAAGELLSQLVTGSPPLPISRPPSDWPKTLAKVLSIALNADPAERYQTAAAMRDDLKRVL